VLALLSAAIAALMIRDEEAAPQDDPSG